MNVKIPKKIHFIWFGKEMPWYILYYISLIKQNYKDYKVKIWTEKDFDPNSILYTKKALERKKYAFISDYLRAKILYEEGGIYLDTDMVPIRNVESLLKHKVTIGFEYRKMVGTGFCAAEPKHPLFKRIMETYEKYEVLKNQDFKFIVNNELWTLELVKTYGLVLNDKLQLLPGDIKVYPTKYFAEWEVVADSYWIHDHKLSWTTPTKAKIMNWFLKMIRKSGTKLEIFLVITKVMYFRKNKKRIKKLNKLLEEKQSL